MMQAHYRSVHSDAILTSRKGFNRLVGALKIVKTLQPSASSTVDVHGNKPYAAMNDDFYTYTYC
jgi:cysteinyl-tRNA synthetase